MNVPKLRFKEFTDEWKKVELDKLYEFKNGLNGDRSLYGKGVELINVSDILNNTYITSKVINGKININENTLRKNSVEYGDILFQRSSETFLEIGTSNVYLDNKLVTFSGFVIRGKRKKDNINNPLFINYVLKSPTLRKKIIICGSGAQHYNIGQEDLKRITIFLPSIKEQKKIADMLELLDKKIELQTKKIEALKLFKKGLLKTEYNKIKNKHLYQLNNIAEIYQPQTLSQKQLENGIYPVFGANGIIGFHSSFNHTSSQITISCRGENAGSINKTPENCWINGNSMVINVDNNQNIDKDYLKIVLESQNLKYLISGSGQPQIIRADIAKHKIPIISIDKQLLYIKKFNLLDSKLLLEIAKLKNLNLLKKGFMQNMFV